MNALVCYISCFVLSSAFACSGGQPDLTSLRIERERAKERDKGRYVINAKCPHAAFLQKHHCLNCTSAKTALEFSIKRNELLTPVTPVNTVFAGPIPSFGYRNESKNCFNIEDMPAYRCVALQSKKATCRFIGLCTGRHSSSTGTFHYQELSCIEEDEPFRE